MDYIVFFILDKLDVYDASDLLSAVKKMMSRSNNVPIAVRMVG